MKKLSSKRKRVTPSNRRSPTPVTADLGLTDQEILFCNLFITKHHIIESVKAAGYEVSDPRRLGNRLLADERIKEYMRTKKKEYEDVLRERYQSTFFEKIEILWGLITSLQDVFNSSEVEKEKINAAKAICGLITELNKMQGDHAPEKLITATYDINAEVQKIKDIMPKWERDY